MNYMNPCSHFNALLESAFFLCCVLPHLPQVLKMNVYVTRILVMVLVAMKSFFSLLF